MRFCYYTVKRSQVSQMVKSSPQSFRVCNILVFFAPSSDTSKMHDNARNATVCSDDALWSCDVRIERKNHKFQQFASQTQRIIKRLAISYSTIAKTIEYKMHVGNEYATFIIIDRKYAAIKENCDI